MNNHRRSEFHRAKHGCDFFTQSFSINNVTAFHGDHFVFGNVSRGEQTAPVNLTLAHLRFWGAVRDLDH
jgi:hypothetical protein